MFSIIACIGKKHELGKKGGLVFHLKNDMKFFRETTSNHTILMGRKTWESLPNKLPKRKNIVVSKSIVPSADQSINNLDEFIEQNQNTDEEIFIIGGGMIYTKFLPYTKNLYLTEVDSTDKDADTFFPKFDKSKYFKTIIEKGSENGLNYTIAKYTKK